jgi:hypothetical protein
VNTHRLELLARLIAWGRIAIGLTAVAAPVVVAAPWVGESARHPAVGLFARTLGGRDLALGCGTLRALGRSDQEARAWVALAGMADAGDAVATVVAFAYLPRRLRWLVLALTLGAAAASFRVAASLDGVPDPDPSDVA